MRFFRTQHFSEMAQNKQKKIVFALDTTGSMSNSLEACKKAILASSHILNLLGFEIEVVCYGDYQREGQTPDDVVTICDSTSLGGYQLSQNGHGGDAPEALASAIYKLFQNVEEGTRVILITDAPPHNVTRGENSTEARLEKLALHRLDFPFLWDEVAKKASVYQWDCLFTGANQAHYEKLGKTHQVPSLTKEVVLKFILEYINEMLENDVSLRDLSSIDNETFADIFRTFALNNPTMLEHLMFLSNRYYQIVRSSRSQTDAHGKFFNELSQKAGVSVEVMKLFKDAQAPLKTIQELCIDYPNSDMFVRCLVRGVSFGKLKDWLAGNLTCVEIKELKQLVKGQFKIVSKDDVTPSDLPFTALLEKSGLCLLASLLTLNFKMEFSEFMPGILPVLASAFLQWSDVPELVELFAGLVESEEFLPWLKPDATVLPPETIWNRSKLQFLMYGLSKVDNSKSPLLKMRMNALERLAMMVELVPLIGCESFNGSVKLVLENLSNAEATKRVKKLNITYDVLLKLWMVPTIFFFRTHDQVIEIVANTRRFNNHFNKSEAHYAKILALSEQLGGLMLSIYSINCHIGDNGSVQDYDGLRYGYRDGYSKNHYVSETFRDQNPVPEDLDALKTWYLERVGVRGENVFTVQNMVKVEDILGGGPQMVACGKKTCSSVYYRQDSSALGRDDCRCGICRKGALELEMFQNKCQGCQRSFVSGIQTVNGITETSCPFCTIEEETMVQKITISQLFSENSEMMANHWGIPMELFAKLVSTQSMAKMFRENPSDVETALPLPNIIFESHGWNKALIRSETVLTIGGLTLTQSAVQTLIELLDTHFMIECGICCETVQRKNTTEFCQNKACSYRFCQDCVTSHLSTITPGSKVTLGQLQCPMCREPVKKGLFRRTVPQVAQLFKKEGAQTPYQRICDNGLTLYLCQNVGKDGDDACCSDNFPFAVDERGLGCAQQMVEAEGDAGGDQVWVCTSCQLREFARRQVAQQSPQVEDLGEMTETGHYCRTNDDGTRTYTRLCPECQTPVEHNGGCFHMQCENCPAHFCWCCGESFPPVEGWMEHPCYEHLRNDCQMVAQMATHQRDDYFWYSTPPDVRPEGHEFD